MENVFSFDNIINHVIINGFIDFCKKLKPLKASMAHYTFIILLQITLENRENALRKNCNWLPGME